MVLVKWREWTSSSRFLRSRFNNDGLHYVVATGVLLVVDMQWARSAPYEVVLDKLLFVPETMDLTAAVVSLSRVAGFSSCKDGTCVDPVAIDD